MNLVYNSKVCVGFFYVVIRVADLNHFDVSPFSGRKNDAVPDLISLRFIFKIILLKRLRLQKGKLCGFGSATLLKQKTSLIHQTFDKVKK
jgi:hypothetical protein